MDGCHQAMQFGRAAALVGRRVLIRRVCGLAARTAPLALILLLLLGVWLGPVLATTLALSAWLVAVLAIVWRRPRSAYQVLALWDQAAGRREDFATAWWVETQRRPTEAQIAHRQIQLQLLPEAIGRLAQDLPLAWSWRLLLPLVGWLSLVALQGLLPEHKQVSSIALESGQRERLAAEIERAKQRIQEDEVLKALQAADLVQLKRALEQAQRAVAAAAAGKGREAMSAAERAAQSLQKKAEQLAEGQSAWASQALIEAIRAQVATADLGDALAQRQAQHAAKAAQALADALQTKTPVAAVQARLDAALREILPKAKPEDARALAGRHILDAGRAMAEGSPMKAGAHFAQLVAVMLEQERRNQGSKALAALAQRLREAGDRQSATAEALAKASGDKAGAGAKAAAQGTPMAEGQAAAAGRTGQAAQAQALQGAGAAQAKGRMDPAAGSGEAQGAVAAAGQAKGAEDKGSGGPQIFAPIPGMEPDASRPAMIVDAPQDAQGKPAGVMATEGGQQPGSGTAPLSADDTEAIQQAALSALVEAQATAQGLSQRREVAGGDKQGEQVSSPMRKAAVDALNNEERSLDEAVLPAARREQIRRYFNELRRRLNPGEEQP